MGWTWVSTQGVNLLNKYPSIAAIPEFVQRWPGLDKQITADADKLTPEAKAALKTGMPGLKLGRQTNK